MQYYHNLLRFKGTFQENFPVGACSNDKTAQTGKFLCKKFLCQYQFMIIVQVQTTSLGKFSWKMISKKLKQSSKDLIECKDMIGSTSNRIMMILQAQTGKIPWKAPLTSNKL